MVELKVHALIDSLTWGGAESLLADLATGAPQAGIDLSVGYMQEVDGSPNADRLRRHGVEPQHVGIKRLIEPSALLRVRRQLKAIAPDIVHTHLGTSDVHGTLAARSLGIPVVSTIHLMAGRKTGDRRADSKERLMAFVRKRAGSRVITVSDAARQAYLDAGWDLPGHVVTVHNGIAPPEPRKTGARMREELGLDPDALVVSLVSVLRPGKGHEILAEVTHRLADRFQHLKVLVIGDGPSLPAVRELMAPLGENVMMLGHRGDVPELLGATDLLVHPTSMDAFPTVLLEAAAMGVPVLATAVGGIPEIVDDGETGVLVAAPPTADAFAAPLESLLADAQLRKRLGAAARARFAEQLTAERWAQRLRVLYDDVLARRAAE